MRVAIVQDNMPHQIEHAAAIAEGLERHCVDTQLYQHGGRIPDEAVVVCWGWRIAAPLVALHKNVLVMERGYIDRMSWCSLGWNGLNGRAQRAWAPMPHRLATFGQALGPWRPDGAYALLIGQVPGDAAVAGIDLPAWYAEAVDNLKTLGLPIKFRPHPVALDFGHRDSVIGAETVYGDLTPQLAGAAVVVTLNSNTGVDAMLAGKPTIARDRGSMVWQVAAHSWAIQGEPENRIAWAENLASSQFTIEELRSGYAWDVVKDSQTLQ